ncbi:putative bifunctional diguanylate cyclase/phosphodiesterase [Kineococcus indalonis]|uniref:putative bifunctional diguanylate cyclase/phosphodiesterase n=1 Tax=Kineococcus indalonis TaxID=2696566 RepID=UPI0014134BA9|nr:bifunctional diguanylate cyclase/phosphodiesterase [Kineococcus indalonis]NAZ87609.1 EAL domain-containing protein [Kineococcus indalonis]
MALEAGLVLLLTVLLTALLAPADPLRRVVDFDAAHPGSPLGLLVLALALSHLLMMVFGARRGRQLAREHEQRARAEGELRRLAREDPLTGLGNRAAFTEALSAACAPGGAVAVLLLDVDGFCEVDELLGQRTGDALLAAVGRALRPHVPAGALARVGDDTFAVLLTGADAAPVAARARARALLAALQVPLDAGGAHLEVGATIGLVVAAGLDAVAVLHRAGAALAAARREGVPVRAHDEDLGRRAGTHLLLHGQLRRALADGQLRVHYQPKVSCADGRVTGVEALVRWEHPQLGLLPPSAFLEVAERSSVLLPLTEEVVRTALADAAAWARAGLVLDVAVNVSARALGAPLERLLAAALDASGVPAARLELEVTETAVMVDPQRVPEVLRRLRAAGHRVVVDDFGTGHATLAYLRDLPVTAVKVDRSFVRHLRPGGRDDALVTGTVQLAHRLGRAVVAEGVEDPVAWAALVRCGCDEAQGYWLSPPVPAQELPAVVEELQRRLAGVAGAFR